MPVRSAAEGERSMIAAHLPPLPTFPTPDTKGAYERRTRADAKVTYA